MSRRSRRLNDRLKTAHFRDKSVDSSVQSCTDDANVASFGGRAPDCLPQCLRGVCAPHELIAPRCGGSEIPFTAAASPIEGMSEPATPESILAGGLRIRRALAGLSELRIRDARADLSPHRRPSGQYVPSARHGSGGRLHFGNVRDRRRLPDDAAADLHRHRAVGRGRDRLQPHRRILHVERPQLLAAKRHRHAARDDAARAAASSAPRAASGFSPSCDPPTCSIW